MTKESGKTKAQGQEGKGSKRDFIIAGCLLGLHLICNSYEKISSKAFIGLCRYEMIESHKAQSKGVGLRVLKSSQKNLKNRHPVGLQGVPSRSQLTVFFS